MHTHTEWPPKSASFPFGAEKELWQLRAAPSREGVDGGAEPVPQDLHSQSRYLGHPSNPWCDDSLLPSVTA